MAAISELNLDKTQAGQSSDSVTPAGLANRGADGQHIDPVAAALSRDAQLSAPSSELSGWTRARVLIGAAAEGTISNGLDELTQHPGQAAGELLSAVAMGVALSGPAWVKLPALAISAVSTVAYGKHLLDAGETASTVLSQMNGNNLESSRQQLKESLGPVIFDSALMYAAGHASARVASHLPVQFSDVKVAETIGLAREQIGRLLGVDGFPPGMAPAFAGADGLDSVHGFSAPRPFKLESILPSPTRASDNILQMSSSGIAGGSDISGTGIRFTKARGTQGEVHYNIDNLAAAGKVSMTHEGGGVTQVGANGKVMVGFNSGEGRTVDIGQSIDRLVMTEHPTGLKQFRFNNRIAADLEVDNQGHSIRALLGNGDHMHMMDNIKDGYMHFPHRDQLQSWVEHSGRVVLQTPQGKVHEIKLPEKLAFIKLLEKQDGSKEFRFLNDNGVPLSQVVVIPPASILDGGLARFNFLAENEEGGVPKSVKEARQREINQAKKREEMDPVLRAYIAARQHSQQNLYNPNLAFDDSSYGRGGLAGHNSSTPDGTMYPHHSTSHGATGFGILPSSFERAIDREVLGVPYGIMRGDNLSSPASAELAMQGHSWVVTNYLDRLGYQEEAHHDYW